MARSIRDVMDWVERLFVSLAHEMGINLTRAGWIEPNAEDNRRMRHGFELVVGGKREVVDFTDAELDDAREDRSVRSSLERRIKAVLRRF